MVKRVRNIIIIYNFISIVIEFKNNVLIVMNKSVNYFVICCIKNDDKIKCCRICIEIKECLFDISYVIDNLNWLWGCLCKLLWCNCWLLSIRDND